MTIRRPHRTRSPTITRTRSRETPTIRATVVNDGRAEPPSGSAYQANANSASLCAGVRVRALQATISEFLLTG